MADDHEPPPLQVPARSDERNVASSQSLETLTFTSPNQMAEVDVDKLKLLFELQEKQKEREFQRRMKLLEKEAELEGLAIERREKGRTLTTKQEFQRLELYFKMFITSAALTIGTILILTDHENVGYFMIGGALSTVTSGVVGLMRASRG